uniref:Uncharacterized protein n=1 Tax=Rhizophora mucronata TaxID=61149 RepID=A0A2P2PG69_RHIMU
MCMFVNLNMQALMTGNYPLDFESFPH